MIEEASYYSQRITQTQSALDRVKKIIYTLGTARLSVILVAIGLIIFFWGNFNAIIFIALFVCTTVFLWLVLKYNEFLKKKDYLETSLVSDKNELKAFEYDFSAYDGAVEKINGEHPFSLDLDLFGDRSFFQSINRTCTLFGKQTLSSWLENPLQNKEKILSRQESIKEMAELPTLIHQFEVTGLINPGKTSDLNDLQSFARQPLLFRHNNWWKIVCIVVPILWIIVISLALFGYLSSSFLVLFYLLMLVISESPYKKVNRLQRQVEKKMNILNTYSKLIKIIEKSDVHSPELRKIKQTFLNDTCCVSREIKKIAHLSGELDQRANMFVHILLNPLMLWDVRISIAIERWKEKHGANFEVWIRNLGQFDALCSLGKFAFNHSEYAYPSFVDNYFEMEGKALGHPLLHRDQCVKNDIRIISVPFFMIVTGANMAGKSTYLRSVGINYLLACIGAPACAESLRIYPAGLFTSLRTSDSLTNNESYFFAELKRLKMIIDRLAEGQKLFIILDEILKGTNSIDKQKGSFALLKQFVRMQSCGIIATHDLALGALENEFPEYVKNYHFDADITDNELSFSYQLRTGIAQNMNACFLMNKMGITI